MRALCDHGAQGVVDLALQGAEFGARFGRQNLVAGADHAAAEIAHDRHGIAAQERAQAVESRAGSGLGLLGGILQFVQPDADAFEQHLILVAEVVVDHRLGHAEARCDILKRSRMEAALVEHPHRRQQQRFPLFLALRVARARRAKGGRDLVQASHRSP